MCFSPSSTRGYNNPRLLTSAYSRLLLSLASVLRLSPLSLSLYVSFSLTRFFSSYSSSRAFLFSLSVARYALPFFLSTHTRRPSFSLFLLRVPFPRLYREAPLHPLLSSSHVAFSRSLVPFPLFIQLFYLSLSLSLSSHAYLSFFASRFILPLARVSDLADFALSFYPPRSSSLSLRVSSSASRATRSLRAHSPLFSLH